MSHAIRSSLTRSARHSVGLRRQQLKVEIGPAISRAFVRTLSQHLPPSVLQLFHEISPLNPLISTQ